MDGVARANVGGQVVLELGLEPVILWQRFQRQLPMLPMGQPTVLVVNLFARRAG